MLKDEKVTPLYILDFLGTLFERAGYWRLFCLLFSFLFICLILYVIVCVFRTFVPGFNSFEGGC